MNEYKAHRVAYFDLLPINQMILSVLIYESNQEKKTKIGRSYSTEVMRRHIRVSTTYVRAIHLRIIIYFQIFGRGIIERRL